MHSQFVQLICTICKATGFEKKGSNPYLPLPIHIIFRSRLSSKFQIREKIELRLTMKMIISFYNNHLISGVKRDALSLRDNVLQPGISYRLTVNLFADGNYREYQYYKFQTNTPPSLGECWVTPLSGESWISVTISVCRYTAKLL